jgi:hypothetical protein
MVKLLIIDEVHLLNDERGAVIETIVARTLRQASFFYLSKGHPLIGVPGRIESVSHPNYRLERHFTELSGCRRIFEVRRQVKDGEN